MRIIVKDLELYGENDILLLEKVKNVVWNKKKGVLSYVLNNLKVDELILINPIGEKFLPLLVEDFFTTLSSVGSIKVVSSINFSDIVLLPENVEFIDSIELERDFSSSPVNNIPKILADDEILTVEISPVWIIKIYPGEYNPVKVVEDFVNTHEKGNVIVVIQTPLSSSEREAIESLAEETGGFIVDIVKENLEPADNIETEFCKRIENRIGKILGIKSLRGESL